MKAKSIMIAGVSALILGAVPALAEGGSKAQEQAEQERTQDLNREQLAKGDSDAQAAQTSEVEAAFDRAGTEIEKSVNADDTFTQAELSNAIKLDQVQAPKQTLATAKVDDMSGQVVGDVRDVILDNDGDPAALHVEVGGFLGVGERMVAIDADRFSYLPDRNILIASLTKEELESMTPISR